MESIYNWTGEVNSYVEHDLVSLLGPTCSHSRYFFMRGCLFKFYFCKKLSFMRKVHDTIHSEHTFTSVIRTSRVSDLSRTTNGYPMCNGCSLHWRNCGLY